MLVRSAGVTLFLPGINCKFKAIVAIGKIFRTVFLRCTVAKIAGIAFFTRRKIKNQGN